jgi:TolB protein
MSEHKSPTSPMLSRRRLIALGAGAAAGTLAGFPPRQAAAQLKLDVTQGTLRPMPIALPDFVTEPGVPDPGMGRNITQIIAANLRRSGMFAPIDQKAYVERITDINRNPRFGDWKQIGADALVTGRLERQGNGNVAAQFRLWDINAGGHLHAQQTSTSPDNYRRLAHIISDQIYQRLTGEMGYFDTRIVFIDESGARNQRTKRLAIMDQDGANVRYLTRGDDLVLTPRFSPKTQEITYMSYGGREPRVFLLNIETLQREVVGNFPNMSFAPRFSPDGQRVIMSLQQGSNANLYVLDLRSKAMTRLTETPAIDTAPSYSPDSARICFESDRGGTQQIYVMGAGGGQAQRISFGEGRYSTPVWSPRGDYIAFTKQGGGSFGIGIMKPERGSHVCAERPRGDVLPRSGRQRRPLALYGRYQRPERAEDSDPGLCLGPGLVAAAVVGAGTRTGHNRDIFTPH